MIKRRGYTIREEGPLENVGLYIRTCKEGKSLTMYLVSIMKRVTIKVIERIIAHEQ